MTDPVYEGKSMQGLIDLVREGYFPAGSKVLSTPISAACRRSTRTAICIGTADRLAEERAASPPVRSAASYSPTPTIREIRT